jgi:hypothetical protein
MCTGGYFRFANDLSQKEHLCTKHSNWAVICTRGSITYSPHDSKWPCAPEVTAALQMICHRKNIYVRNIHTAPSYAPLLTHITILSEHVHRRLFLLCKWSATETTFVSFPIYKLPYAPEFIFAMQSPITEPPFVTIRAVICACSHATLWSCSVQLWPSFHANALLQKEHLKQASVVPCGSGFTINQMHIFCDVWLNTMKVAVIRIPARPAETGRRIRSHWLWWKI